MYFYIAHLFALVPTPTQIWEKALIQAALRLSDWPLVSCFLPHFSGFKETNVHFLEIIRFAAGCSLSTHNSLTVAMAPVACYFLVYLFAHLRQNYWRIYGTCMFSPLMWSPGSILKAIQNIKWLWTINLKHNCLHPRMHLEASTRNPIWTRQAFRFLRLYPCWAYILYTYYNYMHVCCLERNK